MYKYYKTIGDLLTCLDNYEDGCWIYMVSPTDAEIKAVSKASGILVDLIRPALDEEERSRIETDEDQTLILVDIPTVEPTSGHSVYSTIPLGIVVTKTCILTVCLKEPAILNDFFNNRVRAFYTHYRSRLVLQILFRNATLYLSYLRQIEKLSNKTENDLQQSMKNNELRQLLQLEKSLVYFSTSLKSNEIVLEKMLKLDQIKKFEEDQDLLEDVIIENKQAIEMTNIYSSILSGTMDAYASIISNNLNIVMKSLTIITISLMIPSMVSGFFGMNVPLGWAQSNWVFPAILGFSALLSGFATFLMIKKRVF